VDTTATTELAKKVRRIAGPEYHELETNGSKKPERAPEWIWRGPLTSIPACNRMLTKIFPARRKLATFTAKHLGPPTACMMAAAIAGGLVGCKKVPELGTSGKSGTVTAASSASPVNKALTASYAAVWGSASDDVWAVGASGAIGHYDGHTWTAKQSPTAKNLSAIGGSGRADIWAVGDEGTTLHFDGTAWKIEAEDKNETLLGIWVGGKADVWVSGITEEFAVIRHYDGKKWDDAPVTGATSLWETWGSSGHDIWAVGTDHKGGSGFVLRGDGKHFERVPFEGESLRAVWGTGPDQVFVAAYDGPVYLWDGKTKKWTATASPPTDKVLGLWGTGATDVWAVGLNGGAYHYDGQAWTKKNVGTTQALWAAWGAGSSDAWLVGTNGLLLHWNGSALVR
jgi:hypothetical protein